MLAACVVLAPPAGAASEELVPPGNSAVDQYTETYPAAGGDRETRGGGAGRTPAQVLGPRKARRLERRGPAGEAAAALAAATAPPTTVTAAPPGRTGEGATGTPAPVSRADTAGSSGLDEVLDRATGLSGGDGVTGTLLPIAILATLLWAAAYLWRRTGTAR